MSEYKEVKFIDQSLISGSRDTLRTAIGDFWEPVSSSLTGEYLQFKSVLASSGEVDSNVEGHYWYALDGREISQVLTNPSLRLTTSADVYIPNFHMPVRLVGNPDMIENDEVWQKYLFGGQYGDINYPGIYNIGIFDDNYYTRNNPYTALEEKQIQKLEGTFSGVDMEITTKYNFYLKEYQEFASTLKDKQIPNMYMFGNDVLSNVERGTVAETIVAYLSIDGMLDEAEVDDIMDASGTDQLPPIESLASVIDYESAAPDSESIGIYADVNYNLRNYLTASLPELSASTLDSIAVEMQNVIFGASSANKLLGSESDFVSQYKDYFPYYISINIPNEIQSDESNVVFSTLISDNDFDNNLLLLLKDRLFDHQLTSMESVSYMSASASDSIVRQLDVSTPVSYAAANLIRLLTISYQNPLAEPMNNSIFLDELDENTEGFYMPSTPYRYTTSRKVLRTLNGITGTGSPSILQPTGDLETDSYFSLKSLWELYNGASHTKYSETLAYRIEKTYLGNPIQNIWIYNDNSQESFTYYDTQIKYDTDYGYNIYAYDVVVGLKYKYGDWVSSTQIGSSSADTYCLQFTSAETGLISAALFDENTLNTELQAITPSSANYCWSAWNHSGFAGSAYAAALDEDPTWTDTVYDAAGNRSPSMAEYEAWAVETIVYTWSTTTLKTTTVAEYVEIEDTFSTTAQVETEHQFLADFNLYYEPMVSVVEVPLMTKTLRVADNPPPPVEIHPYQMLDDSQRIGFKIMVETFDRAPLPAPLNLTDITYNDHYMGAKDFTSASEEVTSANCSRPATIEVYRLLEKPLAYTEFANHLYKTYNLNETSRDSYDTMTHCIDIIKTNTKYYYMFRAVSQLNIPGPMSDIYEAELINDGGYKYAIFNIVKASDLTISTNIPVSVPIKKLFLIQPSLSNLSLGGTLDYSEDAHTQLENIEVGDADYPIWDKKFKFRLTSKKTGKKIDFNITYKVREG